MYPRLKGQDSRPPHSRHLESKYSISKQPEAKHPGSKQSIQRSAFTEVLQSGLIELYFPSCEKNFFFVFDKCCCQEHQEKMMYLAFNSFHSFPLNIQSALIHIKVHQFRHLHFSVRYKFGKNVFIRR